MKKRNMQIKCTYKFTAIYTEFAHIGVQHTGILCCAFRFVCLVSCVPNVVSFSTQY